MLKWHFVLSNSIIYQHICLQTSLFLNSVVFKNECIFVYVNGFAQQLATVGDMNSEHRQMKRNKTKKKEEEGGGGGGAEDNRRMRSKEKVQSFLVINSSDHVEL